MTLNKLLLLVNELESKIPVRDAMNQQVSKVNVGWHIEHILMATLIITEQLTRSDPREYQWQFNRNRFIVFTLNKIPRGKGKAPSSVIPKEKTSLARMEKYVELVKEKITAVKAAPANSYIVHPYLGKLNRNASVRLMLIHAKHHLHIIHDILQAENIQAHQ